MLPYTGNTLTAEGGARLLHAGQRYGDRPYIAHLAEVVDLLPYDATETEHCAAWLHDSIEDSGMTAKSIAFWWWPEVAVVVGAVTNAQKVGKYRPPTDWKRIASAGPSAAAVKVADRLANVRECVRTGHTLLGRYRREYPAMRAALMPVGGVRLAARWAELDALLGWDGEAGRHHDT